MQFKHYALAFAVLAGAQQVSAQGWITLTDANGNDVTNGSSNEWTLTSGTTQVIHLDATISGAVGRTVNVKRYEMGVQAGTQNYFCWALCYLPRNAGQTPLWVSGDDQAMSPGVAFTGFGAYHIPDSVYGTSCYRYVFYDVNAPTDSAFVDFCFSGVIGVQERTGSAFSMFPNPANGSVVVSLNAMPDVESLVVFNALGEQVANLGVAAMQQTIVLGTGALQDGLYFVSLVRGGRAVGTQRLVVAH